MSGDDAVGAALVRQRRRWPWFVLGLLLGGGGQRTVNTEYQSGIVDTHWGLPFTVEMGDGSNGAGSVGVWDEDSGQARHQVVLQAGTIEFTVAYEFESAQEVLSVEWLIGVPEGAPFDVTNVGVHVETYPTSSYSTAVATGTFAATINRCDPRTWPVTLAVRWSDGGIKATETVDVVALCEPPADDIVEQEG